jgi:multicomponent Na+:H+ antiporter subunit D
VTAAVANLMVLSVAALLTAGIPAARRVVVLLPMVLTGTVLGLGAALQLAATPPRTREVVLPGGYELVVVVDGFAALMVAAVALVAGAVALSGIVEDTRGSGARHPHHWPLYLTVWAGLAALPLVGDLLTTYVVLEVVGLCGAVLVTHGEHRGALLAGTRYLLAELAASLSLLAGIGLIWAATGTVRYDELGALEPTAVSLPLLAVGSALALGGLLLKLPLAPLHVWLPAAHSVAPRAVSPLLSGVMVKAAFVVIMRLWLLDDPAGTGPVIAAVLAVFGGIAIVWGSVTALRSDDLKRLIAASTGAQLGLLVIGAPLIVAGDEDTFIGAVLLAVSHAPAKAAMLLAAACLVDSARNPVRTGTGATTAAGAHGRDVRALDGAAVRRPVAMLAFALGGLSLIGLPPTGGFVAKWSLLVGGLAAGAWWLVAMLLVATGLTTAYLLRCVLPAFVTDDDPAGHIEVDARDVIALVLAASAVVMGLVPMPLVEVLRGVVS